MPLEWRQKIFSKKKNHETHFPSSLLHIITGKSGKDRHRVNPCNENLGPGPEIDKIQSLTTTSTQLHHKNLKRSIGIAKNSKQIESSSSKTTSDSSLDICKEAEIMTYITHLDESNYNQSDFQGTFILQNQQLKAEPAEFSNYSPIVTVVDPLKPRYFAPKDPIEVHDSSEDSVQAYWGSASEKTSSDLSLSFRVFEREDSSKSVQSHNKTVKQKLKKSNYQKRDEALRKAVWENIEVILENFGLTFLDLVSSTMMFQSVNSYNKSNKVIQADLLHRSSTEVAASVPKIIVMIDDPPQDSESVNDTLGRLMSVELYLLGLKLFVIPCYNFAPHVFKFMMKRLQEDTRRRRTLSSSYNFILKTGFTHLLTRPGTDVIIFDGDWLKGDVCQLIALAESHGHELVFMKNHPGIRKEAFVKVVVAKIQTRLNEFDDLRLATSVLESGSGTASQDSAICFRSKCMEDADPNPKPSGGQLGCQTQGELRGPIAENLTAPEVILTAASSSPAHMTAATSAQAYDCFEDTPPPVSPSFVRRSKSLFF